MEWKIVIFDGRMYRIDNEGYMTDVELEILAL